MLLKVRTYLDYCACLNMISYGLVIFAAKFIQSFQKENFFISSPYCFLLLLFYLWFRKNNFTILSKLHVLIVSIPISSELLSFEKSVVHIYIRLPLGLGNFLCFINTRVSYVHVLYSFIHLRRWLCLYTERTISMLLRESHVKV